MDELNSRSNQAKIRVEKYQGQKVVVKSVLHPGTPLLRRVEFWLLKREARALRQLATHSCVPDLIDVGPSTSITMEYREGRRLRDFAEGELDRKFFRQLEDAVREMHDLGIVHSDLKKKDNILVSPDRKPVIVDLGTHFRRGAPWGPLYRFLFEQFRMMDLNAVSKLKSNLCPGAMNRTDVRRLREPTVLERLDRWRREYLFD